MAAQGAKEGVKSKSKSKKNKKMADEDGPTQHPLEVSSNKGTVQTSLNLCNILSLVLVLTNFL